jgi:hypothetical protein
MNYVENLKSTQLIKLFKIFSSSRIQSFNIFRVRECFLLNLQVGEEFEIQRRFLTRPGPPISSLFKLLTTLDRYSDPHHLPPNWSPRSDRAHGGENAGAGHRRSSSLPHVTTSLFPGAWARWRVPSPFCFLAHHLCSSPVHPIRRWASDLTATSLPRAPRRKGAPSPPLHPTSTTSCLTPHCRFLPAKSRRHWLPWMVNPAVPFCLRWVLPRPRAPAHHLASPCHRWWLELADEPPAGKRGRSSLFPIWASQFRPRRTMLFFIFPNDLVKFNSFMNSNF